jgi:hypothetical protein
MKYVQDLLKEEAEKTFNSFLKDKDLKKYLEEHCLYYDADPIHYDGEKLMTITLVLDNGRYGIPTGISVKDMKSLFGI